MRSEGWLSDWRAVKVLGISEGVERRRPVSLYFALKRGNKRLRVVTDLNRFQLYGNVAEQSIICHQSTALVAVKAGVKGK